MLSTLSILLLVLPLVAAGGVALAPARLAKWIATIATLVVFAVSLAFAWGFPGWTDGSIAPSDTGVSIMPSIGINLTLGADAVGVMLILLTTFLMPLAMIGSFTAVKERLKEYYAWFMVLEAAMIGVFLARDAIVFYTAYEFTLVPMYFLIAIYGGADRRAASVKFFLYTFLGSLLTLSGVIYIAAQHAASAGGEWTFDLARLAAFASTSLPETQQYWVFILLMAGFAVKVPFFPVHTWLPLAHDQAPTAGSVILAGTLLKLGTYGVYRIALPTAPVGGVELSQFLAVLCIIGIVYAALICWVQHDAKKLVAYSSVSHLGFCMLGLFSLNSIGATGSVMYMINHGLSTGALFLCIGMIYERYHTKDMDQLGGLFRRMPVWSFFMVFFTLASLGLPGLNGFIGEFLCLMGCYTAEPNSVAGFPGLLGPWYALVAGSGLVLAAMYLLIMLGKLVWGPLREPHGDGHGAGHGHGHRDGELPADLSAREIGILVPLALVCLVIGFYPKPMLEAIAPSVENTLRPYPALVAEYAANGTLLPRASESAGESNPAQAPVIAPASLRIP
ncbi:MAG: NADH-quinone oxidoreductase subunit [Planctomycetota bacterium]|jgi:NADH-quinone oxidoreductase subunit M